MSDKELSANYDNFASSNPLNSMEFFIRSLISQVVSTSLPVVVTAVERKGEEAGAGYVTVKPLLQPRNNSGDGLEVTTIPKLPYFRLQHGKAAIICDPKVGDIGLAVVAKHDISNINGSTTPKVPATYRKFDPSDSFYIGGFWGKAPEVFIHLEDEGTIKIKAPTKITIESPECEVNASASFTVNSAQINLNGPISGGGSGGADATFTGDVKAKGISLTSHTHTGVQSGNSSTGAPQ
ncbi:phage baseplate assembly protein [Parasutterella excrementihominis]|uniref:phage baseplate assembly protein n=1 Tax=Parasutterella excrementihominis TaxID=487175 RepID=UPI0024B6CFD8|nr:phage baseplate assembly protein [Parasutterella excrementihominis]